MHADMLCLRLEEALQPPPACPTAVQIDHHHPVLLFACAEHKHTTPQHTTPHHIPTKALMQGICRMYRPVVSGSGSNFVLGLHGCWRFVSLLLSRQVERCLRGIVSTIVTPCLVVLTCQSSLSFQESAKRKHGVLLYVQLLLSYTRP